MDFGVRQTVLINFGSILHNFRLSSRISPERVKISKIGKTCDRTTKQSLTVRPNAIENLGKNSKKHTNAPTNIRVPYIWVYQLMAKAEKLHTICICITASVLPCASLHPSHCNVLRSLTALAEWRYDRNTNDNEIQLRSYRVGIGLLLSVQFSVWFLQLVCIAVDLFTCSAARLVDCTQRLQLTTKQLSTPTQYNTRQPPTTSGRRSLLYNNGLLCSGLPVSAEYNHNKNVSNFVHCIQSSNLQREQRLYRPSFDSLSMVIFFNSGALPKILHYITYMSRDKQHSTSCLTHYKSFQKQSSQPISWLGAKRPQIKYNWIICMAVHYHSVQWTYHCILGLWHTTKFSVHSKLLVGHYQNLIPKNCKQ